MYKPQQSRSAESLEKVISAAEQILRTRGPADFTVARLVETSGVSVGSIYARFSDKDGVFHELVTRFMRHTLAEFENMPLNTWSEMTLSEALDLLVTKNAEIYFAHRGVLRTLKLRIKLTRDEPIQTALANYSRTVGQNLFELLQRHASEIEHPDVDEAINISIEAMTSMLTDYIIMADTDVLDERGVARTKSLIQRFLQPSRFAK